MFKRVSFITTAVLLTACHSNPYDGVSGKLEPIPVSVAALPPTVQAQRVIDVTENKTVTAPISGTVSVGTPVLAFNNLPSWATFANGTLTLSPPSGAATDPSNPTSQVFEYELELTISSSANPVAKSSQTIVVIVHHAATTLSVNVPSTPDIFEGQQFTTTFKVTSSSFPTGPFQIGATKMPGNMTVTPTPDPTVFSINYTPDFTIAKVTDFRIRLNCMDSQGNTQVCSQIPWTLTVIDPLGDAQTSTLNWNVFDVRQKPNVVVNPVVAPVGTTAEFDVYVSDPNQERIPQVQILTQPAAGGTVTATSTTDSNSSGSVLPYALYHISWTGFPPNLKGTAQSVTFNTCVLDQTSQPNNCVNTTVNVDF